MILVTGGTGFIGRALTRHLVDGGYSVRLLIRPSPNSPSISTNTPVEVAISSLDDERGLRAAMVGVDAVFHLVGAEWRGVHADLVKTDIQSTQEIIRAAIDAGVQRFFYVSHLGSNRASAYPVFKAKAIAEEYIRHSGLDYTILRSGILFGPNDGFSTGIAKLLASVPILFFLPGEGNTLIQPFWVEDLATCLTWTLEDSSTRNQVIEVGGPEYITFRQTVETIMKITGLGKKLITFKPPYLRALTVLLDHIFPNIPISVYWLDYLAANRTCGLDSVPNTFNLIPSRFSQRLEYLNERKWRISLWQALRKPQQR